MGSPLQRMGLYGETGEKPAVVDGNLVNAIWDVGVASTVYKNLGGKSKTPVGELESTSVPLDRFRRVPNSLAEELTLDEAASGAGYRIMEEKKLGDPRYSRMEKWQHVHTHPDGTKTVIHFVVDPETGVRTDFKFQ